MIGMIGRVLGRLKRDRRGILAVERTVRHALCAGIRVFARREAVMY